MILNDLVAPWALFYTLLVIEVLLSPFLVINLIKIKKIKKSIELKKEYHLDSKDVCSFTPLVLLSISSLLALDMAMLLFLAIEIYGIVMLQTKLEKYKKEYSNLCKEN